MLNGVTIRMEKRVSLSTVALLSVLWDKKSETIWMLSLSLYCNVFLRILMY